MATFDLHLRVPTRLLTPLIELVEGDGGIVLGMVELTKEDRKKGARKHTTYANGKRFKGISGSDLAMQVLTATGKPTHYGVIQAVFERNGFAKNSTAAALSVLKSEKKVINPAPGIWKAA
jgi:hypothetical protein